MFSKLFDNVTTLNLCSWKKVQHAQTNKMNSFSNNSS